MGAKDKYYLVKQDSTLYKSIEKMFNWHLDWVKEPFHGELVKLLNFNPDGNIVLSSDFLGLTNVPGHLENQFRVRTSPGDGFTFRKARSNSNINKEYIELCKKYNVSRFDSFDFKVTNNIPTYHNGNTFSRITNDNFVIITRYDYSKRDDLCPIKLRDYLQSRAEYISKLEISENNMTN